jgi:hypothetical protein
VCDERSNAIKELLGWCKARQAPLKQSNNLKEISSCFPGHAIQTLPSVSPLMSSGNPIFLTIAFVGV